MYQLNTPRARRIRAQAAHERLQAALVFGTLIALTLLAGWLDKPLVMAGILH